MHSPKERERIELARPLNIRGLNGMISAFLTTPVPPRPAASLYLCATLRSVVWRSHGRFHIMRFKFRVSSGMRRPSRKLSEKTTSEQLEALLGRPWPFAGRPPEHDLSTWAVTDDWPKRVPVIVWPRWTYSRRGLATCSTRCWGGGPRGKQRPKSDDRALKRHSNPRGARTSARIDGAAGRA